MSENLEGNEPDVIEPEGASQGAVSEDATAPLIKPRTVESGEFEAQASARERKVQPHVGQEHAPRVARSASNQPAYAAPGSAASSKGGPSSAAASPTGVPPTARPQKTAAASAKNPAAGRRAPRARRMSLSLTHVDAWSVAKVTFLLSVAGAIIQIVAAALIWLLLNVVGVFDQVTQIVSSTGLDAGGFNLADVFSLSTVLSVVTIFSIVGVVLFTLLATILAWLYNVVSALVGGVHMTLGDD